MGLSCFTRPSLFGGQSGCSLSTISWWVRLTEWINALSADAEHRDRLLGLLSWLGGLCDQIY